MFSNNKLFKVLYYISFLLVIFTLISYIRVLVSNFPDDFILSDYLMLNGYLMGEHYSLLDPLHLILLYINIIFVILFTCLLILKKDLKNVNILFPLLFILYLIILFVISNLYTDILMIPFIQYEYYLGFIYAGYLFLNIYTLLSFEWKNKKII